MTIRLPPEFVIAAIVPRKSSVYLHGSQSDRNLQAIFLISIKDQKPRSRIEWGCLPQQRKRRGNFFLFEHSNLLPGGLPLHLHYDQEEWFYVIEGEVLVQIGEKRFQLKPGDSVLAPRKVPHAFTAVGATPAKMHVGYSPAGKMDLFFRNIANGTPAVLDAALFRKYGCELVGAPLKTT